VEASVPALAPDAAAQAGDEALINRQVNILKLVWEDVEANTIGSPQRLAYLEEFLIKSTDLLRTIPSSHPQAGGFWVLRVLASLELNRPQAGTEAGAKLLELGYATNPNELVQKALATLERKGWLELPRAVSSDPAILTRTAEETRLATEALRARRDAAAADLDRESAALRSLGSAITVPSIGLEMVLVEAGTFSMGEELAERQVTISRPFFMGKYEVTQAEWRAVMGTSTIVFKQDRLPVEKVSWDDVMAFCLRLTQAEQAAGRVPPGYSFTLPTEAEWEYACRAGTVGGYGGSGKLDNMGWFKENSENGAQVVGQKRPNAWGLYDMHGNVWEWCADWYGTYPIGNANDPLGPSSGVTRVFRGGGWFSVANDCRSANRNYRAPDNRYSNIGFRVVLVVNQSRL